jgi:hypothetical protein
MEIAIFGAMAVLVMAGGIVSAIVDERKERRGK